MSEVSTSRTRASDILGFSASLAACFAIAALGGYWSSLGLGPWYDALRKPDWTPPNWIFGPVWTMLYLAMAVAAWLVWRRRGLVGAKGALALYAFQLALNLAWSGLFFALKRPGLAFGEVVVLWLGIAATLAAFWKVDRVAGLLLAPYLAWVTFASCLNFAVWRLNA